MTNEEIVIDVFRTYDVPKLIKKLIKTSTMDDSYKDLYQITLTILLLTDNKKLNHLYHNDGLRKWISQIIKNKRNCSNNDYKITYVGSEYFEVFKRKNRMSTDFFTMKRGDHIIEKYPSTSDFGNWAWCCRSFERAMEYVDKKVED